MLIRLEVLFNLPEVEEQGKIAVLDIEEIILTSVSKFVTVPAYSVTRNDSGIRYGDSSMLYYIDHWDIGKLWSIESQLAAYAKEKLTQESLSFKIYALTPGWNIGCSLDEENPLALTGGTTWAK